MRSRLLALCAGLLLLLAGCGREALHSQESFVFGTRVEVLVWGQDEARANTATAEVLREFDRLHRSYHAWQPSELTALNDASAAGRPHEVSAELAALIVEAQALAAQGEHLFDPGIGALVQLWGFHDDSFKPQLPDAGKLAALKKAKPSITALKVQGRQVASANPSVALDFGGYLKGVALDRAAAIMRAQGVANALINIGGNVLALGSKGGQPWRVGIQHPRAGQAGGAPLATLDLKDGEAIGTSSHRHLGRLPALLRTGRPPLQPSARSAQRRAGARYPGVDGADRAAGRRQGRPVVGRCEQAAVRRRRRLAPPGGQARHHPGAARRCRRPHRGDRSAAAAAEVRGREGAMSDPEIVQKIARNVRHTVGIAALRRLRRMVDAETEGEAKKSALATRLAWAFALAAVAAVLWIAFR
jgi:thiamine biosynthesis lipoprotein ApbE